MNFAKGKLVVCLVCRTTITEFSNQGQVGASSRSPLSFAPLLIKQNSRSKSFNAASRAVILPTTICLFLHSAVKTKDISPLVSNLTFNYFPIFDN